MRYVAPTGLAVAVAAIGATMLSIDHKSAQTPSATATVVQPEARGTRTYRVRPGDTLIELAERFDVPAQRLQDLNSNVDVNVLQVGQRIRIPR